MSVIGESESLSKFAKGLESSCVVLKVPRLRIFFVKSKSFGSIWRFDKDFESPAIFGSIWKFDKDFVESQRKTRHGVKRI